MIKGSIQEQDKTIVNIYAPNIGAPQYTRQTLTDIKGEIDSNTIIVGDFNTPLTPTDRSSKQKINKETQVLNDALDEMDLIDIFRTFHPNAEECTFFSSAHGTFSSLDHILGHKSNLSKFKKIEIVSSIFSNHNTMRLDINYKKKTVNINAPNIGAPQYTRQTLTDIKGEIDSNTIIVGDFNTPLTPMNRSSKHKNNKEAQVLNDALDEMDLNDINRTFHPNA